MKRIIVAAAVAAFCGAATTAVSFAAAAPATAACNYQSDRDSAGRRCGGRAASVRPGGRLGGDGRYIDSRGRYRIWGRNNDPYDRNPPQRSTRGGWGY